MKKISTIIFILFISISSCKKTEISTQEVEDINSKSTFDLKIESGVSLIFYHASWCSICKEQRPIVQEAAKLDAKTNLIVDLNTSFEVLKTTFSSNTKRNCNKANKEDLTINFESKNVTEYINFFKTHIKNPVSENHYYSLEQIVIESLKQGKGFIALVKSENEIVAASFILKSDYRLIYRTGTSNPKGKELKAMFLLVNELIQQYTNTNFKLDFEGSEIEGVARFYKGFGASNMPYFYYKEINNKLLKVLGK